MHCRRKEGRKGSRENYCNRASSSFEYSALSIQCSGVPGRSVWGKSSRRRLVSPGVAGRLDGVAGVGEASLQVLESVLRDVDGEGPDRGGVGGCHDRYARNGSGTVRSC